MVYVLKRSIESALVSQDFSLEEKMVMLLLDNYIESTVSMICCELNSSNFRIDMDGVQEILNQLEKSEYVLRLEVS